MLYLAFIVEKSLYQTLLSTGHIASFEQYALDDNSAVLWTLVRADSEKSGLSKALTTFPHILSKNSLLRYTYNIPTELSDDWLAPICIADAMEKGICGMLISKKRYSHLDEK